jgi:hypothetical protein
LLLLHVIVVVVCLVGEIRLSNLLLVLAAFSLKTSFDTSSFRRALTDAAASSSLLGRALHHASTSVETSLLHLTLSSSLEVSTELSIVASGSGLTVSLLALSCYIVRTGPH